MLIGISGKAQSGKNTVANMLSYLYWSDKNKSIPDFHTYLQYSDKTWEGLQQHSFGENLKKCLSICCGQSLSNFEDINFKNSKVSWLDMTYRQLLQKFGTAIRKEVSDTFWADSLLSNYTG